MAEDIYLSCTETARQLRQALKDTFPDVKFSVRSDTYAGGASIRVGWTDGPTSSAVKAVCDRFEGATFDGMQDLQLPQLHTVNGQPVHYGANYVFEDRALSVAFLTHIAQGYCAREHCPMPEILDSGYPLGASIPRHCQGEEDIMQLARQTPA